MPFKDASGIECLTLSDLWDEPLKIVGGETCVRGPSPRVRRARNGGARVNGEVGPVAFFVLLDHGPGKVGKSGWRYGPYPVAEGEDPQAVAFENEGQLCDGKYFSLDEALDAAIELNVAAQVMDS